MIGTEILWTGILPDLDGSDPSIGDSDQVLAFSWLDTLGNYKVVFNTAPEFSQDSYTFDVTDDAVTPGAFIGQVSASDVDADDTLTHSIKSVNSAEVFSIDADDGKITFIELPTQTTATNYTRMVSVSDSAGNTDTATVTIIDSAIRGIDFSVDCCCK